MASVAILAFALLCRCAMSFCPSLHADFLRRQRDPQGSFAADGPFTESDGAKHTPYITISNGTASVVVGSSTEHHPMTASPDPSLVHFITHIYVLDQDDNPVAMSVMDPSVNNVAELEFSIPSGVTSLTAYEWCNLHGLWMGPTVNVSAAGSGAATCSKPAISNTAEASFVADFQRRQSVAPFNSSAPYDSTGGVKHVPYITISGDIANVLVGDGEASTTHPMDASSNPDTVHFITHIYVLDQSDNIVYMTNLDPQGVSRATASFTVPASAESLTAYEWCNKHGLWVGPTVMLSSVREGQHLNAGMRTRVGLTLLMGLLSFMGGFHAV